MASIVSHVSPLSTTFALLAQIQPCAPAVVVAILIQPVVIALNVVQHFPIVNRAPHHLSVMSAWKATSTKTQSVRHAQTFQIVTHVKMECALAVIRATSLFKHLLVMLTVHHVTSTCNIARNAPISRLVPHVMIHRSF